MLLLRYPRYAPDKPASGVSTEDECYQKSKKWYRVLLTTVQLSINHCSYNFQII